MARAGPCGPCCASANLARAKTCFRREQNDRAIEIVLGRREQSIDVVRIDRVNLADYSIELEPELAWHTPTLRRDIKKNGELVLFGRAGEQLSDFDGKVEINAFDATHVVGTINITAKQGMSKKRVNDVVDSFASAVETIVVDVTGAKNDAFVHTVINTNRKFIAEIAKRLAKDLVDA